MIRLWGPQVKQALDVAYLEKGGTKRGRGSTYFTVFFACKGRGTRAALENKGRR